LFIFVSLLQLLIPQKCSSSREGIGVSVLLRNWTLPANESGPFATAASDQLKYLLFIAPRTLKGAISQRTNQTQLWADFIYMAPPFIAYYGALQCESEGDSMMWMAYEQVKLYREELFDEKVGLWRHIALGNGTDHKHWATGNAWAAAGALRVLATIQRSHASESMRSHQEDLMKWVGEILDGVWKFQVGVYLFFCHHVSFVPVFIFAFPKFQLERHPPAQERHTPELHRRFRLVC
jgi:hypothetical protein